MTNSLFFHKVLTEDIFNKIGFQEQPTSGQYYINGEENLINLIHFDENSSAYKIEDPKVIWDPLLHNITLSKSIEFSQPEFLFGDHGLVDDSEFIGVALKWFSKESSIIQVKELDTFSKPEQHSEITINFSEEIYAGTLRGNLVLDIFLFDYNTGRTLGSVYTQTIILDGQASLFPIQEVSYKEEPLWWVNLDYNDPLIDAFDIDNTAIVLNMAHKNAKLLKLEKGIGSSPLLLEIIASGLSIIILDIMNNADWNAIMNNESDDGSIGAIIYYFIKTFDWDISSPNALAKTIRSDFDKKF